MTKKWAVLERKSTLWQFYECMYLKIQESNFMLPANKDVRSVCIDFPLGQFIFRVAQMLNLEL